MVNKREWVACLKKNNVSTPAIWGTGYNARTVIENVGAEDIVCVLDSWREEGQFCNIDVVSLETALDEYGVDFIMIAAELGPMLIVFKKIKEICKGKDVIIVDKNGRDLFEIYERIEQNKSDCTIEKLKNEISSHERISFDIFDTLIMRRTLYPEDVFDIVENKVSEQGIVINNLFEKRRYAEQSLQKVSPTINEIYSRLGEQEDWSLEVIDYLCEKEIETEKNVIVARKKMVEMLQYAIKEKKKVVLISDMYLPRVIIKEILNGLGITGYEDILVSCEYQQTKYRNIYEIYKEKYPALSYLHIGDNEEADGICSEVAGIDYFLVPKAIDLLKKSAYRHIIDIAKTVNERSMVGMLIAELFNNPFEELAGDRVAVNDIRQTAYRYFAPFITGFMIWLLKEINEAEQDGILFSARDGYLLFELYREAGKILNLENLPKGYYFYTSRMVSILAGINEPKDIMWMLSPPFDCTWQEVLKERFYLSDNEILPLDVTKYANATEYVMAHKELIYRRANEIKENYLHYIKKLGLKENGRYAFFDFVTCGTCQLYLEKYMPFSLEGYYTGFYEPVSGEKRDLVWKSMYYNPNYFEKETYFFRNYLLFEYVMTSQEASVRDFGSLGEPKFDIEMRTNSVIHAIEKMHKEIKKYFSSFLQFLYIKEIEISTNFLDQIFKLYDVQYTQNRCKIFENIVLIDDFGKNKIEIVRERN